MTLAAMTEYLTNNLRKGGCLLGLTGQGCSPSWQGHPAAESLKQPGTQHLQRGTKGGEHCCLAWVFYFTWSGAPEPMVGYGPTF